jgi:hypothetical protein
VYDVGISPLSSDAARAWAQALSELIWRDTP